MAEDTVNPGYLKPPAPRKLTDKETLSSLNQWWNVFRGYYRRCAYSGGFLDPEARWFPQQPHHGFTLEEAGLKRSPAQKQSDLETFFGIIGSYMPYDYVSRKLYKEATNIAKVREILYEIYDVEINTTSFLDYAEMKKDPTESYRNFWNRLVGFMEQHLPAKRVEVDGAQCGDAGEKLTVSLLDAISVHWLMAIDKRLIGIIKTEYASQLKEKRLCELVKVIARNIDELLQRYETKSDSINSVASKKTTAGPSVLKQIISELGACSLDGGDEGTEDGDDQEEAVDVIYRLAGQFRGRGRGRRFNNSRQRGRQNKQRGCNYCEMFNKRLGANLDTNHSPEGCKNQFDALRLVEADWTSASNLDEDFEGDKEEIFDKLRDLLSFQNENQSGLKSKIRDIQNLVRNPSKTSFIQSELSEKVLRDPPASRLSTQSEGTSVITPVETSGTELVHHCPATLRLIASIKNIGSNQFNWSSILKSKSPRIHCNHEGVPCQTLIDSGAEINVIDEAFARKSNITIVQTQECAEAANKLPLQVAGQSQQPVTLTVTTTEGSIPLILGIVVVIKSLGVDCLVGEPGKEVNNIICLPRQKMVVFAGGEKIHTAPYLDKQKLGYKILRPRTALILQPGDRMECDVPDSLRHLEYLTLTPRAGTAHWMKPRVATVYDGTVFLHNTSKEAVSILKTDHLADLRPTELYEIPPQVRVLVNERQDEFQYQDLSKIKEEPDKYLDEISVDPDSILTQEQRDVFHDINKRYAAVFTPRPGKYNGYYKHIDNSLHFSSVPAPNSKTHIPSYSPTMKQVLAEKMDKLEEWGVLAAPEDYGITVEFVSPSMLVPKKDPGEFRLVTDFGALNTFIKRVPNTSGTIASARAMIAKARYVAHLDFSNFFYQNGMSRRDMQYLGTVHPFKGLRVYTCDAQGCKGASERGYEKLVRIYGDMVQAGQLAQMADGLHVLGNSVQDLALNYIETLDRAEKCGFTFKPKATIICPENITLFGWDLKGTTWTPTAHTVSALVGTSKPNTMKQLRSFIGSFKQISSCIPDYATTLHTLDQLVGGRSPSERIQWTPELESAFKRAREIAGSPEGIVEPRPDDQLHTYSDYSGEHKAVGGRMMIHRTKDDGTVEVLNGGYYSAVLDKHRRNWLPCEGEAIGIKLVLEHFQNHIRESSKVTVHHTDSQPCMMAWKRSQRGAYSTSARIAAFLSGLSALPVEITYTPGKHMHTSDFASRHPPKCKEAKCQICSFVRKWEEIGDNASSIRVLSVEDIKAGRSLMPLAQRSVWLNIQRSDSVHQQLLNLIQTRQLPQAKKTGGDHTRLKLLHNLYSIGKLTISKDGLMVVKSPDGFYEGSAISIPHALFPGLANALHIRLDHPSKAQLGGLLSRYFYSPGWRAIVDSVSDNCHQCVALKTLPKVLLEDTNKKSDGFASEFAVDVIERTGQKILIVKEKLSQFLMGSIIADQTADTLKAAVLSHVCSMMPDSGTVIRTDGATAFQALEREAKISGSALQKLGIKVEIGRLINKNKNAAAEIAVKEVQKEILRHTGKEGPIDAATLSVVLRNINMRVRYHGLSSKEVVFRRDMISNSPKDVDDDVLAEKQINNRMAESQSSMKYNEKFKSKSPPQHLKVGDLVFKREKPDKTKIRDLFIIEDVKINGNEEMFLIRKYQNSLRPRLYKAKADEIYLAPQIDSQLPSDHPDLQVPSQPDSVLHQDSPTETDKPEVENVKNSEQADKSTVSPRLHDRLPRRRAALLAEKKWASMVNRVPLQKRRTTKYGWVSDDQDSDDEMIQCRPVRRILPPAQPGSDLSESDTVAGSDSEEDIQELEVHDVENDFSSAESEDPQLQDPVGPGPGPLSPRPSPGTSHSVTSSPTSLRTPHESDREDILFEYHSQPAVSQQDEGATLTLNNGSRLDLHNLTAELVNMIEESSAGTSQQEIVNNTPISPADSQMRNSYDEQAKKVFISPIQDVPEVKETVSRPVPVFANHSSNSERHPLSPSEVRLSHAADLTSVLPVTMDRLEERNQTEPPQSPGAAPRRSSRTTARPENYNLLHKFGFSKY